MSIRIILSTSLTTEINIWDSWESWGDTATRGFGPEDKLPDGRLEELFFAISTNIMPAARTHS